MILENFYETKTEMILEWNRKGKWNVLEILIQVKKSPREKKTI